MTLVVDVTIPVGGGLKDPFRIGSLIISRLEPLGPGDDHSDEVHPYHAFLYEGEFKNKNATLSHRYGDGAWTLISNALAALGHPEKNR